MQVASGGALFGIDLIDCAMPEEAVDLQFGIADDDRFDAQIATLSRLLGRNRVERNRPALLSHFLALQARDAATAGLSLREIAAFLLGPGEWPGDGEHRKSRVRRLVASGEQLLRAGPRAILSMK